jgi:hypothetical protein
MTNASHQKLIFDHLIGGQRLTGLQALNLYGCYRLSSVINRIRKAYGYDSIKTEIEENERYAIYSIDLEKIKL